MNAGKLIQGRKRFLAVETLGLGMSVVTTAAHTSKRAAAPTLLTRLKALNPQSIAA